jgi:arabinose-5-phosphate isomerase
MSKRAADIMTANPRGIAPDALAAEALNVMNAGPITVLFAVEDQKPVGILHVHDLLRAGVI